MTARRSLDRCEWDDGSHGAPERWAIFPDGSSAPVAVCAACWQSIRNGTWQNVSIVECECTRAEAEAAEVHSL